MVRCTKCGTKIASNTDCPKCKRKWVKNGNAFLFPIDAKTCSELKVQPPKPAEPPKPVQPAQPTKQAEPTQPTTDSTPKVVVTPVVAPEPKTPEIKLTDAVPKQTNQVNQSAPAPNVSNASQETATSNQRTEPVRQGSRSKQRVMRRRRNQVLLLLIELLIFTIYFIAGFVPISYLNLITTYSLDIKCSIWVTVFAISAPIFCLLYLNRSCREASSARRLLPLIETAICVLLTFIGPELIFNKYRFVDGMILAIGLPIYVLIMANDFSLPNGIISCTFGVVLARILVKLAHNSQLENYMNRNRKPPFYAGTVLEQLENVPYHFKLIPTELSDPLNIIIFVLTIFYIIALAFLLIRLFITLTSRRRRILR